MATDRHQEKPGNGIHAATRASACILEIIEVF
jgi:hypothetical protein